MKKGYDILFGSTSDEEKVLPGVVRFTKEHPELEVRVHYASADNTPEKVHAIMASLSHSGERRALISGAGMSNVLTAVTKGYAAPSDLVIGIPITDSITEGVSSLLSTSEKPPLNPVLAVGLDDSYAALNIANRFMQGRREKQPIAVFDHRADYDIQYDKRAPFEATSKIMEALKALNQPFELKQIGKIEPDDIVISPFYRREVDGGLRWDVDTLHLKDVDGILKTGSGIQVAVYSAGELLSGYERSLRETQETGLVSIGSYKNAAQIAAVLTGNEESIGKIRASKDKKAAELNAHQGLLIAKGEVTRL